MELGEIRRKIPRSEICMIRMQPSTSTKNSKPHLQQNLKLPCKPKMSPVNKGTTLQFLSSPKVRPHKLSMMHGVFIPTCENMWGVLIFLRFHQIIAYAGVSGALLIVVLSTACALFTAVSVGAICNSGGASSQGGPYIMISRALGAPAGAAVGSIAPTRYFPCRVRTFLII